jgi:hypothetical protein
MDTRQRTSKNRSTFGFPNDPSKVFVDIVQKRDIISSFRGRRQSPLGWHECCHTKVELVHTMPGGILYGWGVQYKGCSGSLFTLAQTNIPVIAHSFVITQEQYETLIDSLDLGVATKVSLPNVLIDMVSMRSAFKNFKQKHKGKLPNYILHGGQYLDPPAIGWLIYNYGIRPFVSDFGEILQTQRYVSEKIAKMKRMAGKQTGGVKHFTLPSTVSAFTAVSQVQQIAKTQSWTTTTGKCQAVFYCRYKTPVDIQIPSASALMQDYLGIRKFGDVAWDVLPFSFVLDWFVNTQSWVRNFNVNNIHLDAEFSFAGYQCKDVIVSQGSPVDYAGGSLGSPTVTTSVFTRGCGGPIVGSGGETTFSNRFHLRQLSYAAALIKSILK